MTNELAVKQDANAIFGSRQEISALANRIKTMLPGGEKLSENESLALAQVATITKLNPFMGEVWYIPGKGPMIGIKGARRIENEDTRSKDGYSWMQFEIIAPEDSGAPDPKKVFRAYKCTINDSDATKTYLSIFKNALEMLRAAASNDPYLEAKELCGPRPTWEGFGFSLIGESSRMAPDALARKRAEADALKKRVVLPFGADISENDSVVIDAVVEEAEKEPKSELQILSEFGYDTPAVTVDKQVSGASGSPSPFMPSYIEAAAMEAKVKDGDMRRLDSLTPQQLNFLMEHSKNRELSNGAMVVLAHDHSQVTPEVTA